MASITSKDAIFTVKDATFATKDGIFCISGIRDGWYGLTLRLIINTSVKEHTVFLQVIPFFFLNIL